MTTHYKYKNLLFYSNRDPGSLAFLQELSRNSLLDQQFVKICVNDPRVRVPQRILQYNKIPVIVCPGFDKPILGEDAISWLRNNNFSEKSNGVHDFGDIDNPSKLSSEYSLLLQEFSPTEYNQFHNDEYNLGFDKGKQTINSQFSSALTAPNASVQDPTRIMTIEDNEKKRGSAAMINQRFEMLQQQRQQDYQSPDRIGGLNNNNSYGQNTGLQQQPGQPMGAAFGNMGSDLNHAHQSIIGPGEPNQGGNNNRNAPTYNPNVIPPANQQPSMHMPNMPNMPPGMQMQMPGMHPGMQMPGMHPGMQTQMPPGMSPGMQMPPGMSPGMSPGMQMPPGIHPGMQMQMPGMPQQGMHPGMQPGMQPGVQPGPPPPISKEELRAGPGGPMQQQMQQQRMHQLQQQYPGHNPNMPQMPNMPSQMPHAVPMASIPQQQMQMQMMPNQGYMPLPNMATNMHRMQAPQMSMQPGYNSSRGSVNPRTYGQPNNPSNPYGPMQGANHMAMTSPHQGLPEPSAANMSNAYHI